jgi:hypothetical protein
MTDRLVSEVPREAARTRLAMAGAAEIPRLFAHEMTHDHETAARAASPKRGEVPQPGPHRARTGRFARMTHNLSFGRTGIPTPLGWKSFTRQPAQTLNLPALAFEPFERLI